MPAAACSTARWREEVPSVIASGAKQSSKPESKDWIASSLTLLAMTADMLIVRFPTMVW
jgi:hypothetical protein